MSILTFLKKYDTIRVIMVNNKMSIIGANELVQVGGHIDVPAKIDTGADSSSIWASDINISKDGTLTFKLFGEGSPFYDGKIFKRTEYKVAVVRSATGEEQIRYRTHFPTIIAGKKIHILFNLSDRSKNNYPILIGRRSITGKFLVDVSKSAIKYPKNPKARPLNAELRADPHAFFRKYSATSKKPKPKSS